MLRSLIHVLVASPWLILIAGAQEEISSGAWRRLSRSVLTAFGEALPEAVPPAIAEEPASGWIDAFVGPSAVFRVQGHAQRDGGEVRQYVTGSTPTGKVELGTPPVALNMILDTGSDRFVAKTWTTLQNEIKQVDESINPGDINASKNIYDHNRSSTFARQYKKLHNKTIPKTGYIAYGSGVAMTDEGNDTVKVAGHQLTSFPVAEIAADSLFLLHRKGGASGILGLQHMKNRSLGESVFSRLRDAGALTAFGYCRGKKDDGVFIWGDTSTEGFSMPVIGQMHWAVNLTDIAVAVNSSKMAVNSSKKASGNSSSEASSDDTGASSDDTGASSDDTSASSDDTSASGTGKASVNTSSASGTTWSGSVSSNSSNAEDGAKAKTTKTREKKSRQPTFKLEAETTNSSANSTGNSTDQDGDYHKVARKEHEADADAQADKNDNADEDRGVDALLGHGRRARDSLHITSLPYGPGSGRLGKQAAKEEDEKDETEEGEDETEKPKPSTARETLKAPARHAALCSSQSCTAIIDSGSNIIAGPSADVSRITKQLKVKTDCSNFNKLPTLNFKLGGMDIKLPASAYVMKVKLPKWAKRRPMSLSEGKVQSPWKHVLDTLRGRGLDFGPTLAGRDVEELANLDELCMAALVTLDMNTAHGPLWVVGTPLFDRYYTRWSWKEEDESPKVYLQDRSSAKTCDTGSSFAATSRGDPRLMRAEGRQQGAAWAEEEEAHDGPRIRDADELRYPEWAKSLSQI